MKGEAFAWRGVERPEQGIEVGVTIAGQGGVPGHITAQHAVGVLDAAALPGAVRIAEIGPHAELVAQALMSGPLAAIVERG